MTALYDDPEFFKHYQQMPRSQEGLKAAGEWPDFKALLPDLTGKKVLDLGCGYGWHCQYAAEHGATKVLGVDASEKMLAMAQKQTDSDKITYQKADIEQFTAPKESYDIVLSSLVLHYIQDFSAVVRNVHDILTPGSTFQFTVEHPIFTAEGHQDWIYDENGQPKYFPVDNYFNEGPRQADFVDSVVTKYHHTLTTFVDGLLTNGFQIQRLVEPQPAPELRDLSEMQTSLRVPMMLIIKAQKI